ncbi:class I SAM-dependent methyltransferase [Nitrospira sp. M1]
MTARLPVKEPLLEMTDASSVIDIKVQCTICESSEIVPVISLPNFPITGRLTYEAPTFIPQGIDQEFLMCLRCGHSQLKNHISPDLLYRSNYGFRTSRADSAMKGVEFFLERLHEYTSKKRFRMVLDIGCNDLYLLEQMTQTAASRVGIDPIWMEQESSSRSEIQVIGAYLEDIDLEVLSEMAPDLVVCRHVLEHVSDPGEALRRVIHATGSDAIFFVEVPCLDALVMKYRFDQVFHQHLQYFSLHSLLKLVHQVGGEYLAHWMNYHHWGSVIVAFKKRMPGVDSVNHGHDIMWSIGDIQDRYKTFQNQCGIAKEVLEGKGMNPRYGYGASPMLPTLAYHLQSDLSCLTAIIDDDASKDNWFYENLPVQIHTPSVVRDWEDATVLITAPEGVTSIMARCHQYQPKHVLYPLPLMS